MWIVLSVCFITFMAIVGITEIICRVWLYLMRPKGAPLAVMVISLKEDIAVQQLRYALEFLSWERKGAFSTLAVGTENLSEKTFKEVEKIINSRSDVILFKDLQ